MALDRAFAHAGDRRNLGDRQLFEVEERDQRARHCRERIHTFVQSKRELLVCMRTAPR